MVMWSEACLDTILSIQVYTHTMFQLHCQYNIIYKYIDILHPHKQLKI